MYAYGIFIFAYSYVPAQNSNLDIVRYFDQLERLYGYTLPEAIKLFSDNLFIENFLFWAIAQLRLPHLLPAITTCTVYGIGAYIACDSAKEGEECNIWRILLIQFIMIPFVSTLANVRNVFAFSLAVIASYRDLKKKKRDIWTLLLYIIPVFTHKTGLILIGIRFLVPIFKKFMLPALLLIFSLPVLINYALSHIYLFSFRGSLGVLIRRLIYSANNYLIGESEYAERIRNSLGAAVSRSLVFIFLIILIFFYIRHLYVEKKINDFEIMGYLLCIFTLACNVINTPAYWRFAVAAYLTSPMILYEFYGNRLFKKSLTIFLRLGLLA